ncbi:hypothetical protein CTI12_AA462090 [Artemisia annua]|uniref:DUF4378 domain-containing protein n=1 Tax=Artemisia annua TaxID=35608 RepID=A0A2U1LRU5_ARTAN|nr:hypothetical protein CTI12_AA462090 [Artemisia annua]
MSIIPSRASFSDNPKIITKTMPKTLLLRDFLLDDMSSCSSNGFRSYPRRQRCTTIRFLVEMDLKSNPKLPSKQTKTIWKAKPKPKRCSMLQRASNVMFNAFKNFPFKSTNIMSRNLSRKLLKHGLWKKTDHNNNEVKSGFTATSDSSTTGNSLELKLVENDVVYDNEKKTNEKRVGSTTATTPATNYCDSNENAKNNWLNDQEEQCSPVSVMDFPSDNDTSVYDEEDVSSTFQNRHIHVEERKKLMHKTRRFESVPQLEPVKLEDRIAQSESSTQKCLEFAHEENQVERKAMALLQLTKSTISSQHFKKHEAVESLLLAFFKETMIDKHVSDFEMLQVAKDWMDGQMQEMFLDWECENDRKTYIREMEKKFKWSKYDNELEKENVVLELEYEILSSLVDDILLDFQM